MNIKKAKEDIKNTVRAYLKKDNYGKYAIPSIRQRPVLLMGPPGIGKTQIMQQIAQECNVGLVAYTITHHTRQSADVYKRQGFSLSSFCKYSLKSSSHFIRYSKRFNSDWEFGV